MTPAKTANVAAEAERLRAQAEQAAAMAAEATKRAEEAAQRAEERRQAEILAIRRRRLEQFDDKALAAEESKARAAFEKAVLADAGAVSAFVAWQIAAMRRYLLASEARTAQATLEPDAPPIAVGSPPERRFAEEVQRVIDREVANAVEDARDDLQAELDRAGR